ncbi:MAG: divalent-cation tolerance protein CutA [Desulfurococcales archaeon]|nr:divalent-cation tolerance protein CutA [Desulfurococcales archaeon]
MVLGGWVVVFITTPTKEEAENIARKLVEEKLAACVNIIGGIKSLFWWEGKVDEANEFLLVIKTRSSVFKELVKRVKELHSYSVPEIIALPIIAGSTSYLKWLEDYVK